MFTIVVLRFKFGIYHVITCRGFCLVVSLSSLLFYTSDHFAVTHTDLLLTEAINSYLACVFDLVGYRVQVQCEN